jgi:hypothetical protein
VYKNQHGAGHFRTAMLLSTILTISLFLTAGAFPDELKYEHLVPRQAADPCCKSCGPIAQVLEECAATPDDVYCGCDQWVAAAPGCEACIANSNYNSSFVVNPGPFLEFFWAWCRCQKPCLPIAESFSHVGVCSNTSDLTCGSRVLVTDGPECLCCMETVDPWFSSFFAIWIEQAKELLAGTFVFPGKSLDRCLF